MAFVPPHDRVLDTSTSNSQAIFGVSGTAPDASYNTFSAFMNVGDTTIGGVIEPGQAFVSGILSYSAANQITVTTVFEKNGTFSSSGTKQVFMGLPGTQAIFPTLLRGYIAGLTLSNDGTSPNSVLDIAAGVATDATNVAIMNLAAFTKSTAGAWASGSGSNGMGNGLTIAANTWYHVMLANNGGAPDVYFDTSATGANRPSGITDTKVRRIGSFKTDASSHIIAFTQVGEEFWWSTPNAGAASSDVNNTSTGTSSQVATLASIPLGVVVKAMFEVTAFNNSAAALNLYVRALTAADVAPTGGAAPGDSLRDASNGLGNTGVFQIWTNTSQSLAFRCSANATVVINTLGWIDRRGRDN
jgi:hypothetical protein